MDKTNIITILLAIIFGIPSVAIPTYVYTDSITPKLLINYEPEKNITYFWLENSGNVPIEKIKTLYSLSCDVTNVPEEFINFEVPTLTPSNGPRPSYIRNLDENIIETINESLEKSADCKYLKDFSIFIGSTDFNKNYSFSEVICDSCNLNINVKSNQIEEKNLNYSFIRPLIFEGSILCVFENENDLTTGYISDKGYNCTLPAVRFTTVGNKRNSVIVGEKTILFQDLGAGILFQMKNK